MTEKHKAIQSNGIIWFFLILSILLCAYKFYTLQKEIYSLRKDVATVPPFLVVDFAKIAATYPDGASPEDVDKLLVKTNEKIKQLKSEGFVLLDAGNVIVAPDDMYIPVEFFRK